MGLFIPEGTAPATPAAGIVVLYAKADGFLYSKDDAGTETLVAALAGTALTSDGLDQFAATTSAELRGVLSDETGGGLAVFNDTPTISALVLAAGDSTPNDAPVKMTSGALLAAVEAGTLEYLSGIFYATQDTTLGRGQNVVEQIFRLTADGAAVGPAIAEPFGANSAVPLEANSVYEIIADISYLKTTAGTIVYTLTGSGNMLNLVGDWQSSVITGMAAAGAIAGAAAIGTAVSLLALPATGSNTTAVNHKAKVRFIVETDGAINVRLRVTNSAGTMTLRRGSMLTVRKLPAGNVGTFVA